MDSDGNSGVLHTVHSTLNAAVAAGSGYFAECGLRNAENRRRVICGKSGAERTYGMKGILRNKKLLNFDNCRQLRASKTASKYEQKWLKYGRKTD
jgi:hypothetical protein